MSSISTTDSFFRTYEWRYVLEHHFLETSIYDEPKRKNDV